MEPGRELHGCDLCHVELRQVRSCDRPVLGLQMHGWLTAWESQAALGLGFLVSSMGANGVMESILHVVWALLLAVCRKLLGGGGKDMVAASRGGKDLLPEFAVCGA